MCSSDLSIIDFDNDDNITTNTMWNGENSLTCLQLYDVALNEAQVKRSRDLCQKGGKLCSSSNKIGRASCRERV